MMIRKVADWFSAALWKSIQAEFAAYAEAREFEVHSAAENQSATFRIIIGSRR